MCIKAISWAWKQPIADPGAKLVLLYLADCMNGKDGRCHPSAPAIADATGQCVRTVFRKIDALQKDGLVTVTARSSANGAKVANGYVLNFYPHDKLACAHDTAVMPNNERTGKEPSAYYQKPVRVDLSSKGSATFKEEELANGNGQANGHALAKKAWLN